MELEKKDIAGFIGLGIFLGLIIEKLFVIFLDIWASLLLIFDIDLFVVQIISYLISLIISLILYSLLINQIIRKSEQIKIKKQILIFALFYFLVMIIVGTSGTFFSSWIFGKFVSEQKYSDFLMYSSKNYYEYLLIKSGTWTLEILGIILILFRKIK